jgi:hypothetical protein
MADLADTETQEVLRTIVRETINSDGGILKDIQERFTNLENGLDDRIRKIIREETDDMRTDLKTIKLVQGQQSIMLRTTQTSLTSLKGSYRKQVKEVNRLGGLFEDFEHRFEAAAEL